jgi:hypothetical protein
LDEWRFLLDFFFLAVVVVVAAPDCCGLGPGEETLARFSNAGAKADADADAPHAYTTVARINDALIESLFIFPRISSLLRAAGFQEGSIRRGQLALLWRFSARPQAWTSAAARIEQPARISLDAGKRAKFVWAWLCAFSLRGN